MVLITHDHFDHLDTNAVKILTGSSAGYVITIAGKRIYVSGDTEDNEDVLALKDIDIAFVCCNKPYTMTVGQCVNVVKSIRPEVFIPYHYGGTDIPTDIDALQDSLKDVTKVLIRPLF